MDERQEDKEHLGLVSSTDSSGEFLPLPYYSWVVRPFHVPIGQDECATALYLSGGVLEGAALRLRVDSLRLIRCINRSPRLTRLHAELISLLNDKVHQEYIRAFASEDDRRREWAASKVAATEQFRVHPLAPRGDGPVVSIGGPTRVIISWDDGKVIESGLKADE